MLHLVAGVLFFLLSPGVLLTIPAGSRGLLASGQTSVLAAAVHAIVFVAALYALHTFLNVEGFVVGGCPGVRCANQGGRCDNGSFMGFGRCGYCKAQDPNYPKQQLSCVSYL